MTILSSNSKALFKASSNSSLLWTLLIPTEEPKLAGFTKQGIPVTDSTFSNSMVSLSVAAIYPWLMKVIAGYRPHATVAS